MLYLISMKKKEISKARRNFRRGLIVVAALSAVFFASMVTLRMNRSAHWYVVRNYQNEIFAIDVYKHQLEASLNNEVQKHDIAFSLLQKSVYSKIYESAGIDMMKDNAESGYPPSQYVYGHILEKKAYSRDPVTLKVSHDLEKQKQARYYYNLAALENYAPAIERLEDIQE